MEAAEALAEAEASVEADVDSAAEVADSEALPPTADIITTIITIAAVGFSAPAIITAEAAVLAASSACL